MELTCDHFMGRSTRHWTDFPYSLEAESFVSTSPADAHRLEDKIAQLTRKMEPPSHWSNEVDFKWTRKSKINVVIMYPNTLKKHL